MDVEEGSYNLEPMEDAAMGNPDEEDYVAVPEHEDLDEQQDQSMEDQYVNVPLDDDEEQQKDDDAKSDATTVRLGDHLRKSLAAVAEDQASGSNDSIARNLGAALGQRLKLQTGHGEGIFGNEARGHCG